PSVSTVTRMPAGRLAIWSTGCRRGSASIGCNALCHRTPIFRNMGVLWHKALHPMLAEPRRQPVDQIANLPAGILVTVETDGCRFGLFRQQCFQPDQVETKSGIQRIS